MSQDVKNVTKSKQSKFLVKKTKKDSAKPKDTRENLQKSVPKKRKTTTEETQQQQLTNKSRICGLCLSFVIDPEKKEIERYLQLIRKCLPKLILRPDKTQDKRICANCIKNLSIISNFLDRIYTIQRELDSLVIIQNTEKISDTFDSAQEAINKQNDDVMQFEAALKAPVIIKQEPIFYNESHDNDNTEGPYVVSIPERKCEILEIVDIKPDLTFDFMNSIGLTNVQNLKIEVSDDESMDEDVIEMNSEYTGNWMIFHDHNYRKFQLKDETVWDENVDSWEQLDSQPLQTTHYNTINLITTTTSANQKHWCKICFRYFKSTRKMLVHKYKCHSSLDYPVFLQKSFRKFKNPPQCRICRRHICQGHKKETKRKPPKILISDVVIMQSEEVPADDAKNPKHSKYQCNLCKKEFPGHRNLYQHKQGHNSPNFRCDIEGCNKLFRRRNGLTQHFQREHLNIKKFLCKVCNHSYYFKNDMLKCRHSKRYWNKSIK